MARRFFTISREALTDPQLRRASKKALMCWLGLLSFADEEGGAWPSLSTLAETVGLPRSKVAAGVAELVARRIVRRDSGAGKGRANRYVVVVGNRSGKGGTRGGAPETGAPPIQGRPRSDTGVVPNAYRDSNETGAPPFQGRPSEQTKNRTPPAPPKLLERPVRDPADVTRALLDDLETVADPQLITAADVARLRRRA